ARSVHDADARQDEALALEPSLALPLNGGSGRRGATGDEEHVPPALLGQRRQATNRSRFDFGEPFPEVRRGAQLFPDGIELTSIQWQRRAPGCLRHFAVAVAVIERRRCP